ncbi:SpoIIE family protein phosphatase [Streptomyces sp. NPDC019531]|uniref:ATP-binding SpoIIE family protein phosphatase n=1 Tax=Streptomyces sp. NPDC019531 TaxID=3365062 RepID=UPI0038510C24
MATFDQGNGHCGWSADLATVTLSQGGTVTGWSEGARRLLGHRAPEVVGHAATDLLVAGGVPEAMGISFPGSQEWRGTAVLRHRDGHRVEVTLYAQPSLGADGTAQAFVVAVTTGSSDRSMVDWAFDQASIPLTTYTTASGSWRRNVVAEGGAEQAIGYGGARAADTGPAQPPEPDPSPSPGPAPVTAPGTGGGRAPGAGRGRLAGNGKSRATDVGTGVDTGIGTGAGTRTGTGRAPGAGRGRLAGIGMSPAPGIGMGADTSAGTGPDTGTGTWIGTGADTGTGTGIGTGPDTGTGTGIGTGPDTATGADTGASAGLRTRVDAGTPTGREQRAPAPADEGFLRCVRRVAEEGTPMRYECLAPEPSCAPGATAAPTATHHRAWVIELWPVRDPATGEVVGVGTAAFDSSDQHAARQRLALLQEAGTRVGTTLDVTRTAQELADLAVLRLADFVSVDLLDSVLRGDEPVPGPVDAAVVLRRVAHQSAAEGEGVPEAAVDLGGMDTYPPFSPPARCLADGRAVLSGADDPDFIRWIAGDETRTARNEQYGFHSVMATPLRARGITLGVAVFARIGGSPPFEPDDLLLAGELAGRAAVGVDNARRYTRERTNALTLQRSLLPRDLPRQAAVEVAYRYLPAGTGAGVGGDWFDVVPLSGTRVALVVGDVVGHGIHASATMGRLRTAVRTLADVDLPPDELLTHLDDLVSHLATDNKDIPPDLPYIVTGEIGATCLYAVYDPVSRLCTFASAGHVPPVVLLPDGTVRVVELSPGPLLGIGGLPFECTELELPEGSLLAFCTDGLVESRERDVGLGLERLCEAVAGPVTSLEATCDRVLKALLPESPADDVALLLARTRALHADQVAAWSLPSDPAIVADARAQATRQLAAWGLEEAAFVTELVVSELVTNAIRYGAVPIGLRLIRDRTLICEVSDASSTAPHLRRARTYDEGGRGLHMVAQLTQGWGTRQTPVGKTIWAEQSLPAG